MTEETLKECPNGTILTNLGSGNAYVVVGHDTTGWPILARHITAVNPNRVAATRTTTSFSLAFRAMNPQTETSTEAKEAAYKDNQNHNMQLCP